MSTAFIVSTTDAADELKTAIVVEGGDFWEVHSTAVSYTRLTLPTTSIV